MSRFEEAILVQLGVTAICREHGIAENTCYHWRKTYGGVAVNKAQRLKELEGVIMSSCIQEGAHVVPLG